MNSERSVHIESMLCALGALAGHACQASIRVRNVARGVPETTALVAADTQDGKHYFFGDAINHPLAEAQYSIWAPVASQAQQSGCGQWPDVGEIFQHAAESVGSEAFGQLRVPPNIFPTASPTTTCARCGRNFCHASGASVRSQSTGPCCSASRFRKSSSRANRYSIPALQHDWSSSRRFLRRKRTCLTSPPETAHPMQAERFARIVFTEGGAVRGKRTLSVGERLLACPVPAPALSDTFSRPCAHNRWNRSGRVA